jgi:hypothetical protein
LIMAITTGWMLYKRAAPGRPMVPPGVRKWLMLGLWIAAIALFMLVVGPALMRRPALRSMADAIDERGIEANMYFYTEVEAFYDASVNMDNTWAYTRGASTPFPSTGRED